MVIQNQHKQDLLHVLLEDIVNDHLDDSGPLWDRRRSGVACITPENKAGFIEGHLLLDLVRSGAANYWGSASRPGHEGGGARFRSTTTTAATYVVD